VVIALEGSEKKISKQVVLGFFLVVSRFHACAAGRRWTQAPLTLTLGTSLVLVEQKEANSGCGHCIGRVPKEDLKTGHSRIFSSCCQISCMRRRTVVDTSTPDVDFGDFFGVGGVEGNQLRMWSSHWKGPKRRPQNRSFSHFFLSVARFRACPAERRWRHAPLTLTLGTSLVLVEWKEANSGCGHCIGRVPKEDLKTGRSRVFSHRFQISCMRRRTAVETSAPDVGFGDFFGVGGVEGSQLRMWSSHWKGPKRRPQNRSFSHFFSPLPDFVHAQQDGGGDKRP